jgi:phosphoribosylformylglycinamidine synthase
MLFTITIRVARKVGVFDPEAAQVQKALVGLGFPTVNAVKMGKLIEVQFDAANEEDARSQGKKMGDDLLANPNIERHEIVSVREG